MTIIHNSNQALVDLENPCELTPRYDGAGHLSTCKIGCEFEKIYHQKGNPSRMMTAEQQELFMAALSDVDVHASQEAVSQVLEVQTGAYVYTDLAHILAEEQDMAGHMGRIAGALNLTQSAFSINPLQTVEDCLAQPNSRMSERVANFLEVYPKFMGEEALKFGVLGTSVQCSLGYADADHLFDMARRTFYLTPLFYMMGDNSSGFAENETKKLTHHFRMATNQAHGKKGGIPEFFYQSNNGKDYIAGHIQTVLNNTMMMYFDEQGDMIIPPTHKPLPTFKDLAKRGLNTQANFDLAESMLWFDGKLCNIRDADNVAIGKRFEVRMFDAGPHQFQTMTMICASVLHDPIGGAQVDALLAEYGFGASPAQAETMHKQAMRHSMTHKGYYMDIPFGHGRLSEFAQDFYTIIEQTIRRIDPTLVAKLSPLRHICQTGETDAKVIDALCPSLRAVHDFMAVVEDYAPDLYTNTSGISYGLLRRDGRLSMKGLKIA